MILSDNASRDRSSPQEEQPDSSDDDTQATPRQQHAGCGDAAASAFRNAAPAAPQRCRTATQSGKGGRDRSSPQEEQPDSKSNLTVMMMKTRPHPDSSMVAWFSSSLLSGCSSKLRCAWLAKR